MACRPWHRLMTFTELGAVGCRRWSEDTSLMLFPASWFDEIPVGFRVTTIRGDSVPFTPAISRDTRWGMLAFGVEAMPDGETVTTLPPVLDVEGQ